MYFKVLINYDAVSCYTYFWVGGKNILLPIEVKKWAVGMKRLTTPDLKQSLHIDYIL